MGDHSPEPDDDEDDDDGELAPSNLGTKEHWESAYATELSNFEHHGDEGEVWFGEDSLYRILRWFDRHREEVPLSSGIVDLGCGNGVTCIHLACENYKDVTGVDYSATAIELARRIAAKRGADKVKFEVADILSPSPSSSPAFRRTYHVCVDKGTYDAVSLHPEDAADKRRTYISSVHKILDDEGGLLVITSCNWTEEELRRQFENYFEVKEVLPTPQFQFGGVVGNMVTTIVFAKSKLEEVQQ